MRMVMIKQDTDIETLRRSLLSGRLDTTAADSAFVSLGKLNPHVDLRNLRPGAVLLVPDTPAFKPSASDPVHGEPLDVFEKLLRSALQAAAEKLKSGTKSRADEGDEVAKVLKGAAFKRLLESDPELKPEADAAVEALKKERQESEGAEQALAEASKGVAAALRALREVLGAGPP